MPPPNESLTPTAKLLTTDQASEIAIQALTFLAEDQERLQRFLILTGLSIPEIRDEARTPAFQAAVLEYLMSDESLLMVFCANANLDPALVAPAQTVLDQGTAQNT